MADYDNQVDLLFSDIDEKPSKQKKDTAELFGKEVGVSSLGSFFAGIGSGLFKIPEGFFSLGATLVDLGAGTNKAADVEEFFAKINPFDEYAEATTAGKISEVLTNLAIPVGYTAKAAQVLTKGALGAKKSGNYFKLLDDDGVPILDDVLKKGQKITSPSRLAKLNRKGQALQLGATAGAAGVAESIFVADPEEVGTFGDLFGGGPTALKRGNDYDPERELTNRLKLGIEGAAFTAGLSSLGKGIKQLADSSKAGRVAQTKTGKALDYVSQRFRPRSGKNPQFFKDEMETVGLKASDLNRSENIAFKLDDKIDSLYTRFDRWFTNKTDASRKAIEKQLNVVALSNLDKIKFATADAFNRQTGLPLKTKSGKQKQILKVVMPSIDSAEVKTLDKLLTSTKDQTLKSPALGKAIRKGMIKDLTEAREVWGNLLAIEGRSLDDISLKQWKKVIPQTITDRLDSGYKAFKNNPKQPIDNYPPAQGIIKETEQNFKDVAEEITKGKVKMSNTEAKTLVNTVLKTAKLEKKLPLSNKGSVLFRIPNYFVDKSFASKAAKFSNKQLIQLDERIKPAIKSLLGKDESAMSTILNGSNMLSTVIRRDEMYRNLLINSNDIAVARKAKIKELMKQGFSEKEAAARAPIQTFFDTEADLIKQTGASAGDYRQVGFISKKGEMPVFNPNTDYSKGRALLQADEIDPNTGQPVWKENYNRVLKKPGSKELLKDFESGIGVRPGEQFSEYLKRHDKEYLMDVTSLNPLTGKWTLNGNADALYNVNKNIVNPDSGFAARLYANAVLYPKATSQMAKTILSPFTHMRNFLSAGAFATANGVIPFADLKAVKRTVDAIQLGAGGRTAAGNSLYQDLLRLGVVNSQVQLSDLKALLKDVEFGAYLGSKRAFNQLAKILSKIKKGAQDAYTAEDDFWKIYTYLKESDRLTNAYKKAGIQDGANFVNIAGQTVKFNKETIKQEAAGIVRNNIPNYAYVSDFVKGLRQYPLGNFVSFPAEIIRTGTNIVQRGLDEIFYTVKVGKNTVSPLRSVGLQRLLGMAVTTSAVPYAAVAAGKALYDVSQDELQAMRRFVPKWSKNSTLIPLRSEDGKLKYIDFSHMNAYDTLTRPIQTVINAVQVGEQDKDGIMDDFIMGLLESTKETALPFISESIWTEALADLYMRGGESRDGIRVYNDTDTTGNKLYNSIAHLTKAQAPFNWKQLERLNLSIKATDDKGRFDDRGREYEFGNEIAGIIGARAVEIEPEKAMVYKIANYNRTTRNAKSLFTREVLKGGPVSPKEIYDAYINSNRALFKVQKNMSDDIKAAKTLGMTQTQLESEVINRLGGINYDSLTENIFRPLKITQSNLESFEEISSSLGIPNPLYAVIDSLEELKESLGQYSLLNETIPTINNPFNNLPEPTLAPVGNIPADVANSTGFIGQSNVSIPFSSLPDDKQLEEFNKIFPNG